LFDAAILSGAKFESREASFEVSEIGACDVERAGNVMIRVEDAGKRRCVFRLIPFELSALVIGRIGREHGLHRGDQFTEFKLFRVRVGEDSFRVRLSFVCMTTVTGFVGILIDGKVLRPRTRG
jgi:hypothetical protein